MAESFVEYDGDGSEDEFNITFDFIARSHVHVYIEGSETAAFTFGSDTLIVFDVPPDSGDSILIRRETPSDPLVDFNDTSTITEEDLDNAFLQSLYRSVESEEQVFDIIEQLQLDSGNVPLPLNPDDNDKVLVADGGAWSWEDFLTAQISDGGTLGKSMVQAADAAAGRTLLGLGALATAETVTSAQIASSAVTPVKMAPATFYGPMTNGTIDIAVDTPTAGDMTISLKTLAGTAPSAADPVKFRIPNGTGGYSIRTVTSALSFVASSGSTFGFFSGVAGRLWIGVLDNAGTIELFAHNAREANGVAAPIEGDALTTAAEGGAGAADNAGFSYSTTARVDVDFVWIAKATWESGLVTAGDWDTAPRTSLVLAGSPLPGAIIKRFFIKDGEVQTATVNTPEDDTIPQFSEGTEVLAASITPRSGANLLLVKASVNQAYSTNGVRMLHLHRDEGADALTTALHAHANSAAVRSALSVETVVLAGSTNATEFQAVIGDSTTGTTTINGNAGARTFGGVFHSYMKIEEIQA